MMSSTGLSATQLNPKLGPGTYYQKASAAANSAESGTLLNLHHSKKHGTKSSKAFPLEKTPSTTKNKNRGTADKNETTLVSDSNQKAKQMQPQFQTHYRLK